MSTESNRRWVDGPQRVSSRGAYRIIKENQSLSDDVRQQIIDETRETVDMLRRRGVIKDDMPCL